MRSRRQAVRARLLLGIGAVLTGLALLLAALDPLRQLEHDTVDARFAVRGAQAAPSDVIVVAIDDNTFDELREPWPLRRSLHGRVIDVLREAGARTIAYDVQFTEPTRAAEDDALIRAVGRARGKVVLATTEVNEYGEAAVFGSPAATRELGARVGNALLPSDSDGVIRRLPFAVDGLAGFAAVAAGGPARRGSAWIDFRGPPGTIPVVSFSRVLTGRVDPARFRGKVVVVGAVAPSLQDVHATSASAEAVMSGAEVHANAVWTLRRGVPLTEAPVWLRGLLVVALGMVAPLAARRLSGPRGLLVAAAAGVAYLGATQLLFEAGLIVPLVYPLIALVVATIGVLAVEATAASFERQRVRDLFARFVPESVVDDALASADEDLRLGGRRLQSTVVFCDLRGFTSFTELRPAEEVIDVLNRYLSEMGEAVRSHCGTLLSYSGDGLLAIFGAPLEQPDHADRALAAVREMIGPRFAAFEAWLRVRGIADGLGVGVGVNSGPVMAGNVGCDWRVEYTAIGDTVNTASRLEAMTKDAGVPVLISDTTRAMLREDAPDLRYVDATAVRGKRVKANLWTLDAAGGAVASASPEPRLEGKEA